jgi:drug/metabolite transporter (DMT)-like permease
MFPLTPALGASVAWGASDFLGGLASRRLPVVVVLIGAQAVGLLLAATAWLLSGARLPAVEVIALGGAAGLAELLGFACLYRGLAIGEMSAVAPLAALAAALPVALAVGGGEQVAALEAGGILLAMVGSALTAADPGPRRVVRGAGLGLGAALCFGAFFVLLGEASESGGPAAVLFGRAASLGVLALIVAARPPRGARPLRGDAIRGADATIAVLGSLYPLTTVLLARALLHERLGATTSWTPPKRTSQRRSASLVTRAEGSRATAALSQEAMWSARMDGRSPPSLRTQRWRAGTTTVLSRHRIRSFARRHPTSTATTAPDATAGTCARLLTPTI